MPTVHNYGSLSVKTIVGFGASTMAGVGDSQGGFFKRVEQAQWQRDPHSQFINLGLGGNTTRDMLRRAGTVKAIPADDLVVVLGCNDLPRTNDQSPAIRTTSVEYTRNLQLLLTEIRSQRSFFISSFLVDAERTGIQKATFDSYMGAAIQIAGSQGYSIWNLDQECQADISRYWAADGMHFNDAGHQLIADGVLRWLEQGPGGER